MDNKFKSLTTETINQLIKEERALLCILNNNDQDILKILNQESLKRYIGNYNLLKEFLILYLSTLKKYFELKNENLLFYLKIIKTEFNHSHSSYCSDLNINLIDYIEATREIPFFKTTDAAYNFEDFIAFVDKFGQGVIPYISDDEDDEYYYDYGFEFIEYKENNLSLENLKDIYRNTSYNYSFEDNKIYSKEIDLFLSKYKNDKEMKDLLLSNVEAILGLIKPHAFLMSKLSIKEAPISNEHGTFLYHIEFGTASFNGEEPISLTTSNYLTLKNSLDEFNNFIHNSIITKEI